VSDAVRERPDLPRGIEIRLDPTPGRYVSAECQNGACWGCPGGISIRPDIGARQSARCTCSREGCSCRSWYETNGPKRPHP
jgi:hypothetical protein